jgi:hypothetical protein
MSQRPPHDTWQGQEPTGNMCECISVGATNLALGIPHKIFTAHTGYAKWGAKMTNLKPVTQNPEEERDWTWSYHLPSRLHSGLWVAFAQTWKFVKLSTHETLPVLEHTRSMWPQFDSQPPCLLFWSWHWTFWVGLYCSETQQLPWVTAPCWGFLLFAAFQTFQTFSSFLLTSTFWGFWGSSVQ